MHVCLREPPVWCINVAVVAEANLGYGYYSSGVSHSDL